MVGLKKYLIVGLLLVLLTIIYFKNKKVNQYKVEVETLQNVNDSLYDELFIRHIENGRYELTFDHLKEVNPKLGEEMEEWMSHETE
jgi:hypothetical protein